MTSAVAGRRPPRGDSTASGPATAAPEAQREPGLRAVVIRAEGRYQPAEVGEEADQGVKGRVVFHRLAEGFPEPLGEHCLRRLVERNRSVAGGE